MLCSECGRNQATMHSVSYINGVKSEVYLCPECAAKYTNHMAGDFMSMGGLFDFSNIWKSFFTMGSGMQNMQPVCKTCGTSLADFERTGLLGCEECYDEFHAPLIPVLKQMHGSVSHVEEQSGNAEPEKKEEDERILALKQELKEAIQKEDFERAAILRDQINGKGSEETKA